MNASWKIIILKKMKEKLWKNEIKALTKYKKEIKLNKYIKEMT